MNVRTKLLLGYGVCFFLLLLTSTSAFWGFSDLGRGIDHVLRENYESVTASMQILEALERQDSLLLSRLLNPSVEPGAMEILEGRFSDALGRVLTNITIPNERLIVKDVQNKYSRYRKARERLIGMKSVTSVTALAEYRKETFPAFEDVKEAVRRLIVINRQAMFEADQRSRRAVSRNAVWLGVIIIIAMVTVAVIYRGLHRDVLSRLTEIKTVAEASGPRRVTVLGSDELAAIGKRLNEILDNQQASEAKAAGELRFNRRLLIALLGQRDENYLLVGLDGRVIATSFGVGHARQVDEVASRIRLYHQGLISAAQKNGDGTDVALAGNRKARLRLLSTAPERPIAWLVAFGE